MKSSFVKRLVKIKILFFKIRRVKLKSKQANKLMKSLFRNKFGENLKLENLTFVVYYP